MTELAPSPSVLLVDDDEGIRRDYGRALTKLGFKIETAVDGKNGIEMLGGNIFDVIVCDLMMPRMDGLEFLRSVREQDLDIPVVLITGQPALDTAVKAVEYGAFRYLTKPVALDELERVVHRAASMHRMATLKREAMELLGTEGMRLGDRASLEARFDVALEELWVAFQPIVHWPQRQVFAYEALVRSNEEAQRFPADLLNSAERLGRLKDLGRRVRSEVARLAPSAPGDALLFVNLHPADLDDEQLFAVDAPLTPHAHTVVLEITERASLDGVRGLAAKVRRLRALGYRIAVDDLGAGYAGLATFAQLEPEFVKLDMSLVRGVHSSTSKQMVVRAMTRLCRDELGIRVVSEGVERIEERDALTAQGCSLLQGYLFARPERGFPLPRW